MLANRIESRTLSQLCERVGVAFEVGLDPHRVFEREAANSGAQYGRKMRAVADHVRKGNSLADAIKSQGNYFPPRFAEMIEAGERSGRLDRVLDRLAEYYQQMAEFRSIFMSSILWPMVQLAMAILVVGILIYLPAVLLPGAPLEKQDLLGLGLVGPKGLVTYSTFIGAAVAAVFALVLLIRNGYLAFLVDWAAYVPIFGRTVQVFAEARFVQTLALAIESGMDAASAIDLSFRSAGTTRFLAKADNSKVAINQGRDMHSVLADTGLFQPETLEVVELGEASGRLAETLDKHFKHLKVQVKNSMAALTYLASAIIWMVIAAALVMIIFRVFSLYVNNIGDTATTVIRGEAP